MKVIMYMAMTANGFIATKNDGTDFVTKEESASYVAMVISAGNMIIGHRTYEILSTQPEFQKFLKAGVKIVAMAREDFALKDVKHTIAHSPQEALSLFAASDTIIVAGGGITNLAFLEANLVDEIYLDIEPEIIGSGISLFKEGDFEKQLKFVGVKQLSDSEMQLHYEVKK
jgi:dihydrofolate reductase